ncbi:unnamed protein product [Rhizoctonia solani]|uniref:non-specific serine/threonine protein kinase n=1 Tax=Rhizoctonia solani TaxID=456999 RepID=A0A8H3HHY7_9AGAM|nr:unnamed protein product [Rhizoctonia solani]
MEVARQRLNRDPSGFTYFPVSKNSESIFLARGSAADVWRVAGDITGNGHSNLVYVSKLIRVTPEDFVNYNRSKTTNENESHSDKVSWECFVQQCEEKVLVWVQLAHHNVVKVYGLQQSLNVCVEYCPKGALREYLQQENGRHPDKEKIICDILEGLEYMHSRDPPVVHGNLNAGKIFVDAGGRTKIGEFGLTALCYHIAPLLSTVVFTGFNRWMGPELFNFELGSTPIPTVASDIWALACTIFEIISEKLPYPDYKHDIRVQRAILKGEHPGHFAGESEGNYGPGFWALVESCWSKDPSKRPSIKTILASYVEGKSLKLSSLSTQNVKSSVDKPTGTGGMEEMASEDTAEKMERVLTRGEGIGGMRERANAVMEEFKKSLAAERAAEQAHREAVAARMREQHKVQALIDEELIGDDQKKNAQRKLEKSQGREWDTQKEEKEQRGAQHSTSKPTVAPEFDADSIVSEWTEALPPRQSTRRLGLSPKYAHAASRVKPSTQGHTSQIVVPNSPYIPLASPEDDELELPSSEDPIMSPDTLRGHFKEMTIGPSTRRLMTSLLESARQTGDTTGPPVDTAYSLFGTTSVSYYGRFTGMRTSPYQLSPQQGYFYSPHPPDIRSHPRQEDDRHGHATIQNSTLSTHILPTAPPDPHPSSLGSGLPPPPRQNMQTRAPRSRIGSPKAATASSMRGLRSRSSWEQYRDTRLGFGVDDEGTEDEDEGRDEERAKSSWSWATGQRIHKHTPSFLDLRGRRQSQL